MREQCAQHGELLCCHLCFLVIKDLNDKRKFPLALSVSTGYSKAGLMIPTLCITCLTYRAQLEIWASLGPSEKQYFSLPCCQNPARKTWKGDVILCLSKTLTDVTSVGGSDFLPLSHWIKSISGAQKDERFKDQTPSTLGTVLKPFKPLLGLYTASLDKALCILTSLKASFG